MTCVAIGGTFDVLHDGHKALLKKAHTLGDVIIGLVSDEMAGEKIHVVNTYNSRKKSLIAYIETLTGGPPLIIAPVSYTHLRAHETDSYLVCRLLLEKR